jgi:hypothetical protein
VGVAVDDVALEAALAAALADQDIDVVAPGTPCAALEVAVAYEGGGIRLTPAGGAAVWAPGVEAAAAFVEAHALLARARRAPTHILQSGRSLGVRAELDAAASGGLGGGLSIELSQPLSRSWAIIARGRGAIGQHDRLLRQLSGVPMRWGELSGTAGLAAHVYVAGPLSLEAALGGGVRWTRAVTRGEGCRPPEPCTLSEATATLDVMQHTGPYGEFSLALQLLTGDDWGFDVACTFAVGEALEDQLGVVVSRPLTLRPGVGLRVALP